MKALLSLALVGCASATPTDVGAPFASGRTDPTVATTTGAVLGVRSGDQERFLGIPYATPPTGDLRLRPPEPITPWEEPLAATDPGEVCVQFADSLSGSLQEGEGDEDCLRLCVIRPAGASDLPVLFYVHGGGYASGTGGAEAWLDQPQLADQAILVTHNYRLGPLGFLAHPDLSAEDPDGVSGNLGLRDTLLALQWTHDNAAALGGDPDQILLFGESAGGLSVCGLLLGDEADGLYSAALLQSAPCSRLHEPLRGGGPTDGEAWGQTFAAAVGCDGADVPGCLRDAPLDDLLAQSQAYIGIGTGKHYNPVLDGVHVAAEGASALDRQLDVPLTLGHNGDEGTVFVWDLNLSAPGAYEALVRDYAAQAGVDADAVLAQYPISDYGISELAFAAIFDDAEFTCPTHWQAAALAARHTVRAYSFLAAPDSAGELGSYHGLELGYIFGTGAVADDPDAAALRQAMQDAWVASATGEPWVNAEERWAPLGVDWARWDLDQSGLGEAAGDEACAFWESQGKNPF